MVCVQLVWRLATHQRTELLILNKTQVLGKTRLEETKAVFFLSDSENGEDLESS